MTPVNVQCRLAARPAGLPKATDWSIVEEPKPAAGDGEFVVEVDYLSIDPAMRTWMNAGRSYVPAVEIGEVMRALAVGRIVESHHRGFAVGDTVSGRSAFSATRSPTAPASTKSTPLWGWQPCIWARSASAV
jgi:NADPH-dependent curcumin reductase